ncbi:tRNA (adenosine(37)-N6)-threonylcarbamoyltransferase complex ATPase subunit type 1 TsaE [Lysobacter humi (ex Lee et al. 2017)]
MKLHLSDVEATEALGHALARTRPGVAVAHLRGDLGAGKSTLARALLRTLGVQGAIRSPTYTLVERYPLPDGEAWHLDLYRIGDVGELEYLGLDPAEATLWLIEWPERGASALPPPDVEIALALDGAGRSACVTARSASGEDWVKRFAAAFTAQTDSTE